MFHYSTLSNEIDKLQIEYKKFSSEFEKYIVNFNSCSAIKRKKFIVDQLFYDLQNHTRIHEEQLEFKVNNARDKLEQLNIEFLKGMLNNGFFVK